MTRSYLLLWLAALVIAVFSGCSREPVHVAVPEIAIPVENDVQTLDPAVLSDPHTSRIVWQIYEGLIGLNEDNEVVPMLAESWEPSEDFRTWTFRIRPDVRFHKSADFGTADSTRAVTAEDVDYSYERFAKGFGSFVFSGLVEGFDAYVSDEADDISGFTALDSRTFQVTLTRPDPSFIYRITSPYLGIMPREVVEAAPDEFGRSVASGTGPFMLDGRTDTEVRLVRNPEYWRELSGNLDRVTFRVEKNPQFLVTQLQNGTYHLAQLPLQFYPTFFEGDELQDRFSETFRPYTKTTYNVHYVGMDVRQVTDPLLRRAIAHAVDEEALVERLLYGQATPAASPALPGMLGYQPPTDLPYSLDSARAVLAESSYDGRPLTLLVSDAPDSEQIGELVQSALGDVGINVEIEKLDFNTLITRIFSDNRPDLFMMFSEWIFGAPELILDVYDSSKYPNPNLFGFSDPEVDTLLTAADRAVSREETNALLRQAEALALRQPPALWLYHLRNVYLMDPHLSAFGVGGHNHWSLGDVRWEEES